LAALEDLKAFDVAGATLSLWVFRKSTAAGQAPTYKGLWVETADDLEVALEGTVATERDRIEEVLDYSLLAQNNESSALSITTLETHAGLIVQEAAAEIIAKKVTRVKDIQSATFYVIKLVSGDTVIHAVRRADTSWRTKKKLDRITAFFRDEQLGLDDKTGFDISRLIDFFIVGDDILISNKGNFESLLNYKQAHKEDFETLQAEPQFAAIFTDLGPLRGHVGDNKIQLRRVVAIREKGHYNSAQFMQNLRARHAEFGLHIEFDATGRIAPTPETCRDIIIALLDHRLASAFSTTIYDVPDATPVNV
jgi:hypothetical protein